MTFSQTQTFLKQVREWEYFVLLYYFCICTLLQTVNFLRFIFYFFTITTKWDNQPKSIFNLGQNFFYYLLQFTYKVSLLNTSRSTLLTRQQCIYCLFFLSKTNVSEDKWFGFRAYLQWAKRQLVHDIFFGKKLYLKPYRCLK